MSVCVQQLPVLDTALEVQGFNVEQVHTERFLNLRYEGTDVAIMTTCPESGDYEQVRQR